jgi:hypothetical protein
LFHYCIFHYHGIIKNTFLLDFIRKILTSFSQIKFGLFCLAKAPHIVLDLRHYHYILFMGQIIKRISRIVFGAHRPSRGGKTERDSAASAGFRTAARFVELEIGTAPLALGR